MCKYTQHSGKSYICSSKHAENAKVTVMQSATNNLSSNVHKIYTCHLKLFLRQALSKLSHTHSL